MSSRSQREWQSMQGPCGLAPGRRRPRLLGRQPAGRPAAKVPREGRGARTTRWPHSAAPRRTRAGGVSASELAGAPTAACPPGEQGTRRPERHSSFSCMWGTYVLPTTSPSRTQVSVVQHKLIVNLFQIARGPSRSGDAHGAAGSAPSRPIMHGGNGVDRVKPTDPLSGAGHWDPGRRRKRYGSQQRFPSQLASIHRHPPWVDNQWDAPPVEQTRSTGTPVSSHVHYQVVKSDDLSEYHWLRHSLSCDAPRSEP